MKSVMSHQFSQVPKAEIQRSAFDRSHGYKTTFNSGYLIPVFVDEALPGDTFNLRMTTFARLATPIVPFMDNMFIDSFFFAVPIRLIWNNWQKFNGEQTDPGDSTDFLVPQMSVANPGVQIGDLSDYFGIPTGIYPLSFSSLWHRAYNLIYNEWFRDQNLQDSVVVDKDDGPDSPADYVILRRGKRHDYFTSCLPWPQKGPAVELPLGSEAPIHGIYTTTPASEYTTTSPSGWFDSEGTQIPAGLGLRIASNSTDKFIGLLRGGGANDLNVYADLSDATASTINALRMAFQIQRLYERDARGGTRYTEIIRAHFGVTSPDARLQRPEYLGGASNPININPVAQTSASPTTPSPTATPQGNLSAIGTSSSSGAGFSKSFTEHCVVIGLVSVRADLNYQQGLNRMFSRRTRWDFYWPALSHIGEQAVLNKEIYSQGTSVIDPLTGEPMDESVFGYQERYAEYRYKPSVITGVFRSASPTSLDIWHLAQDFATLPTLDSDFIIEDPPVDRVIAIPTEPQLLFDSYFNLRCVRPMPVYSVPGLIDHF